MPKKRSDHLLNLVNSLTKTEKRHFKIYYYEEKETKFYRLFDCLLKHDFKRDEEVLNSCSFINPLQYSNLKAHLYKMILRSIRQQKIESNSEIKIREQIDFTQLLFDRGLHTQSAEILSKAKKQARRKEHLELYLEILKWEKRLILPTIGRNNQNHTSEIVEEVEEISTRINLINLLTNYSARLNALFFRIGYVRNEQDYQKVKSIFEEIPFIDRSQLSFNEKLAFYKFNVEYYSFIQDFNSAHEFALEWTALFNNFDLKISWFEDYLAALNSLLITQYRLNLQVEFFNTVKVLKALRKYPSAVLNNYTLLKLLKYAYAHEFNGFFMQGDFAKGVRIITKIMPRIHQFMKQIDNHSRIILQYKIACLYFGNDNHHESIDWLNQIINQPDNDLREDIHGFARILNLICHYELGNLDIIDYYIRATYRFLLKKEDMNRFQKLILSFLKKLGSQTVGQQLIKEFERLRDDLVKLSEDPYEKRAFIYFDIISWLQTKIEKKPIHEIIRNKK